MLEKTREVPHNANLAYAHTLVIKSIISNKKLNLCFVSFKLFRFLRHFLVRLPF